MKTVICNSRGQHVMCETCGEAKPHYSISCEPCPVFIDAECEVINFPIHLILTDDTYIKLIDRYRFISFKIEKENCTIKMEYDMNIVASAYDEGGIISKEAYNSQFDNAIKILQKTMYP